MRPATALDSALLAEVAAKSDLVWVETDQRNLALWHVWTGEALAVVVGGSEQADPGLTDKASVVVTLRSKDKGQRLLQIAAVAERIFPDSGAWGEVTDALAPKRLNAAATASGETLPQRWARGSSVWLLVPTGEVNEGPESYSDDAHRREPVLTQATTVTHHPFHFGKATKKRRR